ncbi:MAG: hypothetical protein KKF33_05625 [Alphaproteobacteria bacterium]|nr:hypothetical protein [Alphaproteobacteria bacterium]
MKFLPVLALLPLFSMPAPVAFAQVTVSQCVAIATDAERLACYDGLFRTADAAADSVTASLQSEQLIPARPNGRAPATMTVVCNDGALSVAFSFAGNTMSALGRDAGITLQNDLQAARSRTLSVNSDNTAVLIDTSLDAAAFLDGLAGVTNLTARVTPANSRSLSVRFRVDAFLPEIERVRAACDL